jgi:hypothetical protein
MMARKWHFSPLPVRMDPKVHCAPGLEKQHFDLVLI